MKSGTDTSEDLDDLMENLAMCEEELLETYLETGEVAHREICRLIVQRKYSPAGLVLLLKCREFEEFLQGLESYTMERAYPREFGARVFKIARDPQGVRLTYLKITGGDLKVKRFWMRKRSIRSVFIPVLNMNWSRRFRQEISVQ